MPIPATVCRAAGATVGSTAAATRAIGVGRVATRGPPAFRGTTSSGVGAGGPYGTDDVSGVGVGTVRFGVGRGNGDDAPCTTRLPSVPAAANPANPAIGNNSLGPVMGRSGTDEMENGR